MDIRAADYSATGHWTAEYDERGLAAWAADLRTRLAAPGVTLGLVFIAPRFFPHAAEILEVLRVHGRIGLLVGCSGRGLVSGAEEIEEQAGVAVGLYHLPGARLRTFRFTQTQVEGATGDAYWREETGQGAEAVHGWLAFVDPFSVDCERWVTGWNEAYPRIPTVGGLASGDPREQRTQVYLDGEVFEDGGVAVAVGGHVALNCVVTQGCAPIGETWTVTKAEGNLIREIGNRPAYKVLVETFEGLSQDQKRRAHGHLFLGLVTNEYKENFTRGDFLVRNLLGGDPVSGVIAVGARPRMGQSVQFQCRDAAAATEDMVALFDQARRALERQRVYGGCLCCCSGRGTRLFGLKHHDAALVQRFFGPLGLTGFFGNGEIGPVDDDNFIHGFTAALALFVERIGSERV